MVENGLMLWVIFSAVIAAMLYIDLGVVNRHAHVVSIKEALLWSGVWIAIALLFNLGLYVWHGREPALEFLTGYLIEKSLSVDNLFVFLLIFSYFKVPAQYQHQVLFWGILGALVMRFGFIFGGVALVKQFHWILYVFGVFLIVTGVKLAFEKDKEVHPERNPILKLFRKFMPVTERYDSGRFFIRQAGRLMATPLFVVLLVVETTDVIFAVDSIPAIFGITLDPFIVYSSNAFAILGLRALYFALAGLMRLFVRLHYGLSAILVFVGVKMLIADLYKIPIGLALGVVAGVLALSILASLIWKPNVVGADPPARVPVAAPKPARCWWCWGLAVAMVLVVAAVASILGGADARHATIALRSAHQEVTSARTAHRDATAPSWLQEAEAALAQAYEALEHRDYEGAIAAASRASRLVHE